MRPPTDLQNGCKNGHRYEQKKRTKQTDMKNRRNGLNGHRNEHTLTNRIIGQNCQNDPLKYTKCKSGQNAMAFYKILYDGFHLLIVAYNFFLHILG